MMYQYFKSDLQENVSQNNNWFRIPLSIMVWLETQVSVSLCQTWTPITRKIRSKYSPWIFDSMKKPEINLQKEDNETFFF